MQTTLLIDGGLGRCVTAIPALEKFVQLNPDCNIVTYYWTQIFWGNKILSNNIIDSNMKGLFEKIKDTKIIKPEPYFNYNFNNQRINLIQAFDEEINEVTGNLSKPKLKFSKVELASVKDRIDSNKKTIFFQPFSSSASFINNEFVDSTHRSLNLFSANFIAEFFNKKGYQIVLFDTKSAMNKETYQNLDDLDFRKAMAVLAQSDYVISIDSCCNHIGYALDVPGTTFFGGTSVINYGYPDWFKIIRKEGIDPIRQLPLRIGEFDAWLSEIENDGIMDFSKEELNQYCEEILQDIEEKT